MTHAWGYLQQRLPWPTELVSLAEQESYTRVPDVTNVTKRAALPQEGGMTIKAVCL